MKAIVLSGGGSKGAYQMGVWKALKKLNIKYDIVTGTSVGAINGALMVQGEYHKAIKLWKELSFELLFGKKDFQDVKNITDVYKVYAKNIVTSGGINPKELEQILRLVIKEKKVRNSKINYGMVTVKVPKFKALYLSKDKIPNGKLVDYLMASATCFPAFQMKKINGESYIDGGFYDNMPINLAIKMGADEIIAVDLEAIGVKKLPKKDVRITYISPNNKLSSFLVFDKNIARTNIKYGYNDTLKVFGKLEGKQYSFKKGNLKNNYQKYNSNFIKIAKIIYEIGSKEPNVVDKIVTHNVVKKIATSKDREIYKTFNQSLEYLGKIFKIDDSNIYSCKKFNNLLTNEIINMDKVDIKVIEKKIKNKEIKDLLHTKIVIKYIYDKLCNERLNKRNIRNMLTIATILPKDFLAALYLCSIKF